MVLTVALTTVAVLNTYHTGYEKYWWWDNIAHFSSGLVLGILLPTGKERHCYAGLVVAWEYVEYRLAKAKLYERYPVPEGPRAMGFEKWSFDHQVEDTILDTLMGYYGIKVGQWLKRL